MKNINFRNLCDDDKMIRDQIAFMVNRQNHDSEIRCYASSEEILSDSLNFDMFFLDIEMGDISGLELAREIRRKQENSHSRCIIIFVTGFREYMEDAFDVNAFHYLVKPIHEDKFAEVFRRAEKEISMLNGSGNDVVFLHEYYEYVLKKNIVAFLL